MAKKAITKKEINNRLKYIVLGFFIFFLVGPIRDWIESSFNGNTMLIGIAGIVITFWLFEF